MTTLRLMAASAILLSVAVAYAEPPEKTRADIVAYGATAIGSPYIWGGGNWDPADRDFGGADCSGFVCKCWSLDRWTPYRVDYHGPYSTYHLINTPGPHWFEVQRGDLRYGDAIVYRYDNNQSGHTYLYLADDGWGEHEVYEARGSDYGIVHRWRSAYSGADATKGIRRSGLIETLGVTAHIVEADDGAPHYTDAGMTGASPVDSYALGCRAGDCRYRWLTGVQNQTCTFRPTLPETGWYRVYVTCNEDSPNVHDVGVTVNHALGSVRVLWDQADAAGLNRWVPVGDAAFLFDAGTTGTVVWDNLQAWPADGAHVFRGDATKLVLDNRVEIDGVGGSPGTFATLRDALAWLAVRESEEPDVVNITCNQLVESACVVVDLPDDVTINGDADGDGVPVTIAVTPSVPADWSQPCGLYLDIPIQHEYTLRDIVLVPAYVAAGHATGAYGLVLDEQNPSGQANACSLTLERVTVAGSLPGQAATDALVDQRAAATMFGGPDASYGASVLQRSSAWGGDAGCRQAVFATDLTITHSTTRGLALTAAYTDWDSDGGLLVTYCGREGVKADHIGDATLTIRDSTGSRPNRISHNLGGGVANAGSGGAGTLVLANAYVTDNQGTLGGALTSNDATTILRNCVLARNTTSGGGGGALAVDGTMTIEHCTLADNAAAAGGGAVYSWTGNVMVRHSILWGNGESPLMGAMTMLWCNVAGGCAGVGNMNDEPGFVAATAGDYRLLRTSPCINAGDPAFVPPAGAIDLDGAARVQAGRVDLGAFESSFWAGDVDHDGDVDANDLAVLLASLAGPGIPPTPPTPIDVEQCLESLDYDADADVDVADLAVFQAAFGA